MNTNIITKLSGMLCLIWCILTPATSFCQSGEYMRANLYYVPSSGPRILVDGNFTQYDNQYSNDVDIYDVWKMTNLGENFGIIREGFTLVMERRKVVPITDTTYFRLWNLQQKDYQMEIITHGCNHPDLNAYMEDAFTGSETQVLTNDTTRINFTVNAVPGSGAQNRFTLLYKTMAVSALPLVISSVNSHRKNMSIGVEWKVENESGISSYIVEKSRDGNNFTTLNQLTATNSNTYSYSTADYSPFKGDNYYRIHAVTSDNRNIFSNVTKTNYVDLPQEVNIYPNPVINKEVNVRFDIAEIGIYKINIYQATGLQVLSENRKVLSPVLLNVKLPANITPGLYNIIITGPSGFTQSNKVVIL